MASDTKSKSTALADELKTSDTNSFSSKSFKTASAPTCPIRVSSEAGQLIAQTSAPSYLSSLKENEAPLFKKPCKEIKPKILIGAIMTEIDAIEMVAVAGSDKISLQKWLGKFLVEKKIIQNYELSEKEFLVSLLMEVVDYAAQRDLSAYKLSVLITIYLAAHLFFKCYYWLSPYSLWDYFKEIMIRHTIEDIPDGKEVFNPEESYDIVTHFHTVYLCNLPLVHIVTFGVHHLKLRWPFKS